MTSKTEFSDEEWARLKRAPFVAGMAISLADPGGPIEVVKETANAAKEGGFMGFHAQRVSEGEQRMLDKLAEVLPRPA